MRDVEDFAREHDLEDIVEHLKKGALVAQDPNGFDNIEMLAEEEKQHLRFEKQHKWKHPLQLCVLHWCRCTRLVSILRESSAISI